MQLFTLALVFLVLLNLGVDADASYNRLLHVVHASATRLMVFGLGPALGLLLLVFTCNRTRIYPLLQILSYVLLGVAETGVYLLSLAACWYAANPGRPLWIDLGLLIFMPVVHLVIALCCLRMIDFNYPVEPPVRRSALAMFGALFFLLCLYLARSAAA